MDGQIILNIMTNPSAGKELGSVQSPERRHRLGLDLAHTLLMAVEARAWVGEYQLRLDNVSRKKRARKILVGRELRQSYNQLLIRLKTIDEISAWREREAAIVVDAHPSLRDRKSVV